MTMTREEWLNLATAIQRDWIVECEQGEPFELPLVSVGFPKGHRGSRTGGTAIGQCWSKVTSGDGKRSHIFVSPTMTKPTKILMVLLHELIHASVGTECGHRGPFKSVALEVGLVGKMTSTTAGDDLEVILEKLSELLGEYPHPGLTPRELIMVPGAGGKMVPKLDPDGNPIPVPGPGSRSLKCMCADCGYTARTTRKWLDLLGPPCCPCNLEPMEE